MAHQWRNWAGDQRCSPKAIARPGNRVELVEAIERAREAGETVRVAASGHSFTDIACTDGHMLRLEALDRILDVDRSTGHVRVEAGISLHRLSAELQRHGLALENMGDIDVQTLAGAISTGTHGTGSGLGNLSTQVAALELALADGSVIEVGEEDLETLRAARVSLGALGVIVTATLRCTPAFTLSRLDHPAPLAETLERLDEIDASNDHFEFYVFPYSDVALLRETKRTDEPPHPRGALAEWFQEDLLENRVMGLVSRAGRRFPSQIPRLNRTISRFFSSNRKTDQSYRVFSSTRKVKFTEMEYALPRAHGAEALRRVMAMIEERRIAVGFPIEFRLVAGDDSHLSPANGRATAYIAVHMFEGMEWEPYLRAVEEIMDSYDGRPHWGKRHFQTAAKLASRYPDWERFQAVRARLDPDGLFRNGYTDRVLGSVPVFEPGGDGSYRKF